MASYTPRQYAEQRRVLEAINRANLLGVCVQCGQPQGYWPDGLRRVTCGARACYLGWLRVREGEREEHEG